jgi:regulation of enolase protein 1 (concanavalin A-like superfamily)
MDPGDPRPPAQAATSGAAAAAAGDGGSASDPTTAPLHESFACAAALDPRLAWLHRPAAATHSPSTGLRVVPLPGPDWWANTGRRPRAAAADGAFLGAAFTAPLDAAAGLAMHHRHDWDQAGLLVHVTDDCWLKINAERVPGGRLVLATAVTNGGWTDLATFPLAETGGSGSGGGGSGGGGSGGSGGSDAVTARLLFRVRVDAGGDVALAWAPATAEDLTGGGGGGGGAHHPVAWRRVRLAHLHALAEGAPVRVGPYALAPARAGFIADVRWLRVEAAGGGVLDD